MVNVAVLDYANGKVTLYNNFVERGIAEIIEQKLQEMGFRLKDIDWMVYTDFEMLSAE